MKKLFAMILAVAMVLSMASVAFAAVEIEAGEEVEPGAVAKFVGPFTVKDSVVTDAEDEKIAYGDTVYYVAQTDADEYVTDEDVVAKIKIKEDWTDGKANVVGAEIVKVKAKWDGETKTSVYALAVKTKDTGKTGSTDVKGKLTISCKGKYAFDKIEDGVVEFTLGYDKADDMAEVGEDPALYEKQDDDEFEFVFVDEDGVPTDVTFVVDMTHQKDIVLSYNEDEIDEVVDAYPAANLDFHVFNNATFKKTGELFIPADEGSYLYAVKDGKVVAVDAEYDKYDEGFYLKTKTLGAYVVSDVELKAAAADATAVVVNPSTGAAL